MCLVAMNLHLFKWKGHKTEREAQSSSHSADLRFLLKLRKGYELIPNWH